MTTGEFEEPGVGQSSSSVEPMPVQLLPPPYKPRLQHNLTTAQRKEIKGNFQEDERRTRAKWARDPDAFLVLFHGEMVARYSPRRVSMTDVKRILYPDEYPLSESKKTAKQKRKEANSEAEAKAAVVLQRHANMIRESEEAIVKAGLFMRGGDVEAAERAFDDLQEHFSTIAEDRGADCWLHLCEVQQALDGLAARWSQTDWAEQHISSPQFRANDYAPPAPEPVPPPAAAVPRPGRNDNSQLLGGANGAKQSTQHRLKGIRKGLRALHASAMELVVSKRAEEPAAPAQVLAAASPEDLERQQAILATLVEQCARQFAVVRACIPGAFVVDSVATICFTALPELCGRLRGSEFSCGDVQYVKEMSKLFRAAQGGLEDSRPSKRRKRA
ncbi:hypothetical protein B484DRAFT_394039 [Ochromonadaceae sp. CCMP2298]|nr:hypothetical protein B484DRAFT_394039 [Ochromonadaceae sp. CCMP2298]|mmetsp:Transcript_20860/g.45142  ORF Transcript_20860/g.45142 Transcript_20860/m.45142 type:complete len:387 (+) Transcript_20860:64-1224(+)|eukprot:CAMPEP_0173222886 /NCGR_PEP_ID=MMETSP1142-20121109/3490_1 /TAXON_ID=483371 /ORGANISM="non described non described, Strain CCMP2298" /LENGTH=386 /DNA_ID=CAMNT_0014151007 /DNA_START=15 /DNA_END=1175 /DNA_ORIENTATION=+